MLQYKWFVIPTFFCVMQKLALFQSNNREVDICLTRAMLRNGIALRNNYLRPVGTYDFQFRSAPPKEIQLFVKIKISSFVHKFVSIFCEQQHIVISVPDQLLIKASFFPSNVMNPSLGNNYKFKLGLPPAPPGSASDMILG